MITGIGTDILEIHRIQKIFERLGMRIVHRFLTKNEIMDFQNLKNKNQKINFLAKRFCAKEAFLKALGTGLRKPYNLNNIEIAHDDLGKPFFIFHGKPKIFFKNAHLSLSDTAQFVVAFVILEAENVG